MRITVELGPRIGRRGVGSAVLFGGLLGFHAMATPEALASKLSGNIIERAIRQEEGALTSMEKTVGHTLTRDYRAATHALTVEHHQQAQQLRAVTKAQTAAIQARGKVAEETLRASTASVDSTELKDERQMRQMARYLKTHHLAAQALAAEVASGSTAPASSTNTGATSPKLVAALESLRSVNPAAFDRTFPKLSAKLTGAAAGQSSMHFDHILGQQTLSAATPKVPDLCLEKGYHSKQAAGHAATTGHRRPGLGTGQQGISPAPVPEPGALACGMLALGFGAWSLRNRRAA